MSNRPVGHTFKTYEYECKPGEFIQHSFLQTINLNTADTPVQKETLSYQIKTK